MKNVIFHPLAEQELIDATAYYEEQKPGLGLEFLEEVEEAVNFLMLYPEAGSKVKSSARRIILPKFSYSLFYRILEDDRIRILAVAHQKRRTQYWAERE
ncbi:Plasmid stabilization system protein, RelE/ParE family [Planktothrix tepida]|uniref:Plasmid stabilization system protein, RelE/ParE family n=2 Tax=Planktothrix TaxID=54304 RepID=A0A1J1LLU6_9CYAN|nr:MULTISPECIES: type II toxin-antitoxin system RelE/ParE family toxin [Planktothrix]CAD5925250.1 Plasmid stabilization system protein, RelE/ParE family [Planktothrix pseudagardhii]CAD5979505.1 Plasmid stabilization system protein, RelE/ParE family [Planktothrix tepida]CUR33488.1 Plasmid stabilization system protein, RelE/ParE family [Planktothrix tepida PCC 9214]